MKTPGSARRESVVFNYHSDPEGLDDEEVGDDDDDDDDSPTAPPHRGRARSLGPDARDWGEFMGVMSMPGLSGTTPGSGGARPSMGAEDPSLNDSTLDDSIASIELPRRAPPDSYLNRMSFGFRLSDNFADLDELGAGDESLLHHMAGGGDIFMSGVNNHHDVDDAAAGGDESAENIWEGLDMGDSTRDLNRRYLIDDEAATGEIGGGLYEDSLGGFQLMVPELVPDEDGERSGDEDGVGDRMDIDGESESDEQEEDDDDNENEDEHLVRLGEAQSGSPSQQPLLFHELGEAQSKLSSPPLLFNGLDDSQALPPYAPSLSDNDTEQPSTFPSSKTKQQPNSTKPLRKTKPPSTKPIKFSRHNLPIPSLPPRLIKKLAANFAGSAGKGISNETLAQIIKASDAFFENACVRLGEYAEHAGRKTVGEGDVELLMKRYVLS